MEWDNRVANSLMKLSPIKLQQNNYIKISYPTLPMTDISPIHQLRMMRKLDSQTVYKFKECNLHRRKGFVLACLVFSIQIKSKFKIHFKPVSQSPLPAMNFGTLELLFT